MLITYKNANIYQRHGIEVLHGVNFEVDEGEMVYIIGRVGSGKSTLLKTIYCDLDIDEALSMERVFDMELYKVAMTISI